jgi:CRP/FNR family cyclic AMP-dependent transcriptional regulator
LATTAVPARERVELQSLLAPPRGSIAIVGDDRGDRHDDPRIEGKLDPLAGVEPCEAQPRRAVALDPRAPERRRNDELEIAGRAVSFVADHPANGDRLVIPREDGDTALRPVENGPAAYDEDARVRGKRTVVELERSRSHQPRAVVERPDEARVERREDILARRDRIDRLNKLVQGLQLGRERESDGSRRARGGTEIRGAKAQPHDLAWARERRCEGERVENCWVLVHAGEGAPSSRSLCNCTGVRAPGGLFLDEASPKHKVATHARLEPGSTMIDVSTLRRIPLFRDFTDEQLGQVLATVSERRYPKHQFIVREGEPGDTFFVIAGGSVAVCRVAPDGRETILSILKEGDFFGEMSMFDSSLRSASIKTLTDVEVGAVRRDDFMGLIDRNPQIGKLLVIELSERLRAANALIAATTSQDIRARLASLLLNLAEQFGESVDNGTRITLRLTNQEMANMIGTTRETVNRTLNRFWDDRLVDMRTAHVVVTEPEKLRALIP